MGLFNLKKDGTSDYTIYDYIEEIKKVREEELKSNRYILAYNFLSNNYWNRQNKNLEDELFEIVGTYGIEDEMFNKSDDYKKSVRLKRYSKLKKFINSLTDEQIDSNIFLKRASLFMKMSIEDCSIILNELNEMINNGNQSRSITLKCAIPDKTQKYIPEYISTQTGIKYYRPEAYKIDYIDVLDSSHKQVYEDYNDCITKIGKIAEDIYFLQLNNLTTLSNDLMCYHFQIYHPGYDNHFRASFFVKSKEAIQKNFSDKTLIRTEDFIQTTINNFQALLDMGLIDMTVLNENNNNNRQVLKKTLNSEIK